jgi:hypothetical protein
MSSSSPTSPAGSPAECFDPLQNGNLPPMPYRDMPEPLPLGKVLGPSVILAGLGVGSGEYIMYLPKSDRWSESRVYFLVAWCTIAAGSVILLSGVNQPLLLLTIAACLNGMVMFVYSILLIQLNRRGLPPAIRVRGLRLAMLVVATLFYGFFSGWLVIVQMQNYLAQS